MSPAPALAALLGAHDSASVWTPASLADLVGWYDASDVSSITQSAGAVSQLADKSGNANHIGQTAASAKPTTGVSAQNGLNVLYFDSTDRLANTAGATMLSSTTVTVYLMFALDVLESDCSWSMWKTGDGDWNASTGFQYSARTDGVYYESARKLGPFGVTANSAYRVVVMQRNGASWVGRVNGAQVCTGSGGTSPFAADNCKLGSGATGKYGEVIVYSSFHGSSDLAAVEGYLKNKWGTP